MQGQINPKGHLQGSINPTGNLQGTMSTESLIGGQVVGMRGLKGEKGEQGDTGNGIASAFLNDDYTLTLAFTDGTSYTTPSIRGEQGEDGVIGRDGTSIDTIAKTSTVGLVDTYTITLTDGTTHTFEVTNGQDGADGEDGYTPQKGVDYFDGADGRNGVDGQDGYSPSATVTKNGKTATITITDKNGTTTASVSDGEDGASDWEDITGKPSTFPPSSHNHDSRYYTEQETNALLSGKADVGDIPTKTSELTNDSGFLTQHQSLSAYRKSADQDIIDATKLADAPSDNKQYARKNGAWAEVQSGGSTDWSAITNKPSTFPPESHNHTKSEITDFSHTHDDRYYTEIEVDSQLGGKVDKVSGKGLSSNDYTTAEKNTLSAIASGYRTIFVSTAEPTSAEGNDGDIWVKYGD